MDSCLVERDPVEEHICALEDPKAIRTQSPQENYDEVKISIHYSLIQILFSLKRVESGSVIEIS